MLPREELFFRVLIFFALFSAVAGILNVASSGSITINDMGLAVSGGYQGGIPGQFGAAQSGSGYTEGANTAAGIPLAGIDFTTAPEGNHNITIMEGWGTWTLTGGQGLILTSTGPLSGLGVQGTNAIYINNVQSVGTTYTVNTKIDNSVAGGNFGIYARNYLMNNENDLKLVFSSDGIHLKKSEIYLYLGDSGDDYFYPLPNAQNTISGGSTITTVLTEVAAVKPMGASPNQEMTSLLTVSKDGVQLFTVNVRSVAGGTISNQEIDHAGVETEYQGFILKGFPSTPTLDTSENIISGTNVDQNTAINQNPLAAIGSFWALVAGAMGLSNQSVVPFWLWCIVGLPCIAVLTLIGIEILRGV